MKAHEFTHIIKEHLLSTKVGEEVSFIVPNLVIERNESLAISLYSPLQPQDEFFIAEDFYDCLDYILYESDHTSRAKNQLRLDYGLSKYSRMTSEQSRFHGVVIDVGVKELNSLTKNQIINLGITSVGFYPDDGYPLCEGFMIGKDDGQTTLDNDIKDTLLDLCTRICGSNTQLTDHVFYITVKRAK